MELVDADNNFPSTIREKINAIHLLDAIHLFLRSEKREEEILQKQDNVEEIKQLFNGSKQPSTTLMDYFSTQRTLTRTQINILFSELFAFYRSLHLQNDFLAELFRFYGIILRNIGVRSEVVENWVKNISEAERTQDMIVKERGEVVSICR